MFQKLSPMLQIGFFYAYTSSKSIKIHHKIIFRQKLYRNYQA